MRQFDEVLGIDAVNIEHPFLSTKRCVILKEKTQHFGTLKSSRIKACTIIPIARVLLYIYIKVQYYTKHARSLLYLQNVYNTTQSTSRQYSYRRRVHSNELQRQRKKGAVKYVIVDWSKLEIVLYTLFCTVLPKKVD